MRKHSRRLRLIQGENGISGIVEQVEGIASSLGTTRARVVKGVAVIYKRIERFERLDAARVLCLPVAAASVIAQATRAELRELVAASLGPFHNPLGIADGATLRGFGPMVEGTVIMLL